MTTTETPAPDLAQVKQRQQTMWASGDFHAVATLIQPVPRRSASRSICRPARASSTSLAAAATRRSPLPAMDCDVVGIDYVPSLLARGRRRAEAEGVSILLLEADAETIPFPDASFDAVLSVFGAMFAPNHPQAAAELTRVCRPGGKIGLATWRPDGFIGELLKVAAAHVPPPPGVASPILWGTEQYLSELFGAEIDTLACTERTFKFRARSAEAFVDLFRTYYGPTLKAFEAVGDAGADALYADLVDLVGRYAGASTGPVAIPATWLETVAIRSTEAAAARA